MTEETQATRFFNDMAAAAEKMVKAAQLLGQTRDKDVAIGTTPKHLVMRRDKVELFRYEPPAEAMATTPALLACGLIGCYTMADLLPDRSLVRSLRSKGLDLWLIDRGHPGLTERWLTIDDSSRALGAKIGSNDYTEIPFPGGHVGLFVSSKSQGELSKSIADWLIARDAASAGEA